MILQDNNYGDKKSCKTNKLGFHQGVIFLIFFKGNKEGKVKKRFSRISFSILDLERLEMTSTPKKKNGEVKRF